jgi:flagellin-specific chaperone FliS
MNDTSTQLANDQSRANAYLVKEVLESTPQRLLIKVFDFAIMNCKKGDVEKTNKALSELIKALNFENPEAREMSLNLLKLYQYSQEEMRKNNTEIVLQILTGLRDTWQTVFSAGL